LPYTPYPIDRFGGLDLYNDPQEVGPSSAVDMLNVDLDQRGRLRSRDGTSALSAAALTNQTAMSYFRDDVLGNEWIVTADATTLRTYKLSDGTASTSSINVVTNNNGFARFGDPSNMRLYAAVGSTTMPYAQGSIGTISWLTFVAPVAADICAVTASDNRLVIANSSDLGSGVFFSDAGVPNTFTYSAGPPETGNIVRLWPGDGETIKALVRWRDYLFAFKQTKFAVFTGTGTNSAGQPIFNYRPVDAACGVGTVGQAVAGAEGVYFADPTGIYVTTGEAPRYISRALEPWLRAGSFGSLPTFTLSSGRLVYHDRRLYVIFANGANSAALVYDPTLDAWMVTQFGATAACSVPSNSSFRALYFGDFSSKKVAKVDSTVTTDMGSAISWRYQTGYYDLGSPLRKRIRKIAVLGSGAVTLRTLALNARSADVADPGGSLVLGTAPALAEKAYLRAVRGEFFAHRLSGTTPALVSRLTPYVINREPDA
jgi:hypothetical protein